MPEVIEPPTHTDVAKEWLAMHGPNTKATCASCAEKFPIDGIGGPSLICPRCGFMPGKQSCRYIMEQFAAERKRGAVAAAAIELAEIAPSAAPPGLEDVIGNSSAVCQIRTALEAHRARVAAGSKAAFPHIFFVGPAGAGKSTLAAIVARECKHKLHEHLGQSLNDPRAMVAALLKLKAGDILYIDELHGLKRTCTETLYTALEGRQVSPISSRGNTPLNPVRLPPFTLIGATTDEYKLTDSFKQRFQYHIHLKRLTVEELASAIAQRAERLGIKLEPVAAEMIAQRSHGTPRKAVMLLNRCADAAMAGNSDIIDAFVVESACDMAELDSLGLPAAARAYLRTLENSVGPVKLNVLASMLAVPPRVVEVEIERDLIYLALITKAEKGRVLTDAGRKHLKGKL